jgi:UDP:flavonoid glycosyltransferase YjiC (YdhE family)
VVGVVLCGQAVTNASIHDVPLAEALLARGHRVTVLTGEAARERYAHLDLRFVAVPERAMPPLSRRLPPFLRRAQGVRQRAEALLIEPLEDQWRILNEVLATSSVDVVLGDAFFLALSLLVRMPRGRRPAVITLGHFPLLFPDPLVAPFGLGIAPSDGVGNRVVTAATRAAAARSFVWLSRDHRAVAHRLTGVELTGDIRNVYDSAEAWAQLSVPRFEYPRSALPANLRFVGPLHPPREPPLPDWWDPAAEPPVVVVQHGASADLDDLVLPAVRALGDAVVTLLITGAAREDVAARTGPLPANVHFEQTAPWSRLIPGRAVVVSTGDYVEVQHALRRGLPVVVAGTFEPDIETAARVEWSGVGVDLRTRQPADDVLRDAVLHALHDARLRRNAAAIAAQIAATDGEAAVCDLVEEVIAGR